MALYKIKVLLSIQNAHKNALRRENQVTKEEFDKNFKKSKELFERCSQIFIALGDPMRQHLLLQMVRAGTEGVNVSELTGTSILSRPAISHHLKVLKNSGLVSSTKKQTKIFYRLELANGIEELKELVTFIEAFWNEAHAEGGQV